MEYNYTSLNPGEHNINLTITCKHGNSINSNYDFTLIDAIHNAKLILTDITDSDSNYNSKIFNYNIIPDNPSSTKVYAWDEYTYALILDDSDAIPLTSPTGTQTFTNLSEGEHNLVLQINCKHGVTKYTSSKFEIIEPCYIDLTNVEYSIDKNNYNITYNLINPHFDTEELTYNVILNDTTILTENNSYNYSNLNPGDYNFGISLLSCKHKHNKNLPNYNFKLLEILDYTNLSLENITEEPNLPNDSTLDDADQSTYKTYYISQYARIILEFKDNSCINGWFYAGPTLNHFYLDRDPVTQLHSFSTTDNIVTAYYESVPITIDLLNTDTIIFGNTKYSLSYNQPRIDKHFPDNYDVSSTYTFKYNTTLTDNKLLFAYDQLHGQLILDDITTYNCNSALSGIIEIDTTTLTAGKHKLDFIVICQHGNVKTQSIEFNVDSLELPPPAKNTLRFQFSQQDSDPRLLSTDWYKYVWSKLPNHLGLNIWDYTFMDDPNYWCGVWQGADIQPKFNSVDPDIKIIDSGDLSDITNMYLMFNASKGEFDSLTEVTIRNTPNLTNVANMFQGCTNLRKVVMPDLQNCTRTDYMFFCTQSDHRNWGSLETVDLGTLPSTTDATFMFYGQQKLKTIDLPDLSNLETANAMFSYCSSLQIARLKKLDNLKIATDTFSDCIELQEVELDAMPKLENASQMFVRCTKLTNPSTFITPKLTNVDHMFYLCMSLETVKFNGAAFGVPSKYDNHVYCNAFAYSGVINVEITGFNNATSLYNAFNNCTRLKSVSIDTIANVKDVTNAFYDCTALETVNFGSTPELNELTDINGMFTNCKNLNTIQLFNTKKVTNITNVFKNCSSLTEIPEFDFSSVTNASNAFESCTALTSVPNFDLQNAKYVTNMFSNCTSLKTIPELNIKISDCRGLFYGCVNVESGALALYNKLKLRNTAQYNCFTDCGKNTPTGAAELAQIPTDWGGTFVYNPIMDWEMTGLDAYYYNSSDSRLITVMWNPCRSGYFPSTGHYELTVTHNNVTDTYNIPYNAPTNWQNKKYTEITVDSIDDSYEFTIKAVRTAGFSSKTQTITTAWSDDFSTFEFNPDDIEINEYPDYDNTCYISYSDPYKPGYTYQFADVTFELYLDDELITDSNFTDYYVYIPVENLTIGKEYTLKLLAKRYDGVTCEPYITKFAVKDAMDILEIRDINIDTSDSYYVNIDTDIKFINDEWVSFSEPYTLKLYVDDVHYPEFDYLIEYGNNGYYNLYNNETGESLIKANLNRGTHNLRIVCECDHGKTIEKTKSFTIR